MDDTEYIWKHLSVGYIQPTFDKQSASFLIRNYLASTNGNTPAPQYFTSVSFDALSSRYELDTSKVGDFLQLTHYDSKKKEIYGEFQLSFILTYRGTSEPNAPDRIEFTQGKFVAKAPEEWFQWDKKNVILNEGELDLKQKREEILAKIFPFNDLKTIVLNSLQATVIVAIPSCPGQNRLSEVAPKSMSQFSDTLLYFCGCPSQTFLAKSSFTPGILILSEDSILGRS